MTWSRGPWAVHVVKLKRAVAGFQYAVMIGPRPLNHYRTLREANASKRHVQRMSALLKRTKDAAPNAAVWERFKKRHGL